MQHSHALSTFLRAMITFTLLDSADVYESIDIYMTYSGPYYICCKSTYEDTSIVRVIINELRGHRYVLMFLSSFIDLSAGASDHSRL